MKTKMRSTMLLTLGLLSLSPLAPAAVVDSAANGFSVQNTAEVPVNATRAWSALIDEIHRWWPQDHTWFGAEGHLSIQPVAGGCFCEHAGQRQVQHLQVAHAEPGKLLRMLGGLGPLQGMGLQGVLDFRLEAIAATRTKITLFHRVGGYTPDDLAAFAPIVDRVQAQQLGGLAAHLGGKLLEPEPDD